MRTATIFGALTLALALAIPAPTMATTEPNPEQSGSNSDCLDFMALWAVDGVHSPNNPKRIEVDPGTRFLTTASEGEIVVDFYNVNGSWIGWNNQQPEGVVPTNAAYGMVCVYTGPTTAVRGASYTWTYQDGFAAE